MTVSEILSFLTSPAFATIGVVLFLIFAKGWQKKQGEMSIFHDATSIDDVGASFLMHALNRNATRRTDGAIELRPAWGFTIFTPILLYIALTAVPWDDVWPMLGITQPTAITAVTAVVLLMIAHVWIWHTFFHKITYDTNTIKVVDDFFRSQKRDLADLISIEQHKKRPLLEMQFKGAKPLRATSSISHRANFIADMNAKIEENRTGIRRRLQNDAPEPDQTPVIRRVPFNVPETAPAVKDIDNLPTDLARF